MMLDIDHLRRSAKRLRKSARAADQKAIYRIEKHIPQKSLELLQHADYLHVIARENDYGSWPELKLACETQGMDRSQKQDRLGQALFLGQAWVVKRLLAETPDLAQGNFGLSCAMFDLETVRAMLEREPALAVSTFGDRRPILHLAFSRYLELVPDLEKDMIAIAEILLANGADPNDSFPFEPGGKDMLSALYGAIGHSNNMVLGAWLLAQGADPNDGESLYHSTELGHHRGLEMLLDAGANPAGTNALLRAIDFDDATAVGLLLAAGADPNEGVGPDGTVTTIPALHQAARRNAGRDVTRALISHGARADLRYRGHSAYAMARFQGNNAMAQELERVGYTTGLDHNEYVLAAALDGQAAGRLDDNISYEIRCILERQLRTDASLETLKRLVEVGVDPDWTDEMDLPAIHVAGWEGRADVVAWLLSFDPDLNQKNGFGGDLLGTILHGAENCDHRAERDHPSCIELVLNAGALVRQAEIDGTGLEHVSNMLSEWVEIHPDRLVR